LEEAGRQSHRQSKKRKALVADLSRLQLGQDTEGKTLYIAVKLEITLPTGEVRQFQALYDSGAEINLIRYDLVKEHKLIPSLRWRKPIIGFLDKHRIKLHSVHELIVSVADMHNRTKVVGPQPF
jgi:hypothetical protein